MKKQLNGNFLFLFFFLLFEIFYSLVMKKHCKLIRNINAWNGKGIDALE